MSTNRVIGKNNALPWRLPEDLKRFKSLTMGHAIIMGRKTYESIGRPLPGRTNIIVTSQPDYRVDGAIVVHSLEAALDAKEPCGKTSPAALNEQFIIGGGALYRQTIALAQRMHITEIHRDIDGDTYFPEFDQSEWCETSRERCFLQNDAESAPLQYDFVVLDRKKNGAKF